MKKLLAIGLCTAALATATRQEASAWTKFGFSAGISMNYEGGNNRVLWGLASGGQVPGYPTDVGQHSLFGGGQQQGMGNYGGYPGAGYPMMGGGPSYGPGFAGGPSYGPSMAGSPSYGPGVAGQPAPSQAPEWLPPMPKPAEPKTSQGSWYGNPQYQPAYYQYYAPTNYPQHVPQYNYNYNYQPTTNYQQAPSYWYGY